MSNPIAVRIRKHVLSHSDGLPFASVPDVVVQEAESKLGFEIPPLLKACYAEVGNGGIGPGYGLIGLEGGAQSDFGSLVDTYHQLKSDHETVGEDWPSGLLPFCSWGCNIFSCVECGTDNFSIQQFEEGDITPQPYNLQNFFEMWIDGVDILSQDRYKIVECEIVNPFTGEITTVRKRFKP